MIDSPGGAFWWPEADTAFMSALKGRLRPGIPVIEMDCNINDPAFAERCAQCLLENVDQTKPSPP